MAHRRRRDGGLSRAERTRARLNPSAVFRLPEEVVACEALSRSEKIEVLLRWEYDATEVDVATEEGMGDARGERDSMHGLVREALSQLNATDVASSTGPAKHGGHY